MRNIYIYPWDILDEGLKPALSAIYDVGGMDGVSLATVYHSGRFLSPHNPKRKDYFPEGGVQYFPGPKGGYAGLGPFQSELVKERDIVRETVDHNKELGKQSRSWTVCAHTSRLATSMPELAIVNCLGEHSRFRLCPANKTVRQYLAALIADLAARYEFDAIELEAIDYVGFRHGYHHEKIGIPLSSFDDFVLGVCFCPDCIQSYGRAGSDVT